MQKDQPSPHPYDALTPEVVLAAVESLGILTDARILALNSYENRVYQVGVEGGAPVVVKFYRPGRWTLEQILEEHAFAWELADLEIPVVAPARIDGEKTLFDFDGFRFSVFPRIPGRAPELDNPDNLLVIGRFLGRVHRVGAQASFVHRGRISIDQFAVGSREFLLSRDFLPPSLVSAYDTLSRDLIIRMQRQEAQVKGVKTLRIHGDCHPGNILWHDDAPSFVDFDDTLTGPAIQDLWMMLSGDRDQQQGQLLELIEGYNEFYDFHPRELQLIEVFRTLRIMHYAAWLARRWEDPAFPHSFPWFNTERYWASHVLELREQLALLDEPPLELRM
jgi:Ser/Thr protein kinase RdoA (MazF antagonist)